MADRISRRLLGILVPLALLFSTAYADESAQPATSPTQGNDQAAAAAFFNQIASQASNPYVAAMARESAARLSHRPEAASHHEIPVFSQPDNSIAVPAMVNSDNSKAMGTFIIDTGSSFTVITPRMARKLGVQITPETPTVSIITANGVIQAPMVTLRNVMIGQVRVTEVQAVVQDLGKDLMVSGLLGMNFFKGKSITIRQDRLILDEDSDAGKLSIR